MKWIKKSETSGYCCVHNVDCPEHGNPEAKVLVVSPRRTPSSWMCAEAVLEINKHTDEATEYVDEDGRYL